jgi:hypothetical protein
MEVFFSFFQDKIMPFPRFLQSLSPNCLASSCLVVTLHPFSDNMFKDEKEFNPIDTVTFHTECPFSGGAAQLQ